MRLLPGTVNVNPQESYVACKNLHSAVHPPQTKKEPTMKTTLSLVSLLGLALSACSDASNSLTGPDNLQPN